MKRPFPSFRQRVSNDLIALGQAVLVFAMLFIWLFVTLLDGAVVQSGLGLR